MSFLALKGASGKGALTHSVSTASPAPSPGVHSKVKSSKDKHRLSKNGSSKDFGGLGTDLSWNGRRARASSDLSRDDPSVHGFSALTLGFAACWVGLKAYGFLVPTTIRSSSLLAADKAAFFELLTPWAAKSGSQAAASIHGYLDSLMRTLSLWPALHAATVSRQKAALQAWGFSGEVQNTSTWPLAATSFAFGVLALMPLLSSWRLPTASATTSFLPRQHTHQLTKPVNPRAKSADFQEQLQHRNSAELTAPVLPAVPPVLLVGALASVYQALTSGRNGWSIYHKLLQESNLARASTIDFLHLTAQHSSNGGVEEVRSWDRSDTWLPLLSALPVVCPVILSLLHPSHQHQSSGAQLRELLLRNCHSSSSSNMSSSSNIGRRSGSGASLGGHRKSKSSADLCSYTSSHSISPGGNVQHNINNKRSGNGASLWAGAKSLAYHLVAHAH